MTEWWRRHEPKAGVAIYTWSDCGPCSSTGVLVQGEQWGWSLRKHRDLDKALLDALAAIHSRGVVPGDLHDGSILVTADGRICIVDFEGAELQAPAATMETEMRDLSNRLAHPVPICPVSSLHSRVHPVSAHRGIVSPLAQHWSCLGGGVKSSGFPILLASTGRLCLALGGGALTAGKRGLAEALLFSFSLV